MGTGRSRHSGRELLKIYRGDGISYKYVLFLWNVGILSDDLIVTDSSFQIVGAATEKASCQYWA